MATQYREEIRRGVESLINCLICTDQFTRPKVLPCQHTFCLPCLEKFYDSFNTQRIIRTSNFPCPQCRKTVYLPNTGLDGLPNDFKVGQIQDVFDKIHITIENKGINCDVCRYEFKRSKSESFCAQCGKYLCGSCTQTHSDNTLFTSHSTIPIDKHNVDSLICTEHKEEIKYYCPPCKTALCTVCALSKHSKHQTLDVAVAMDTHRNNIAEYAETLKANLVLHETKAEQLAGLKKEREKNVSEIKDSVRKHYRDFINRVKEDETRLYDELDKSFKILLKDVDKEIDSIHTTVKNIRTICDAAEGFLQNGQSLDLLNKYEGMMGKMKKYAQPPGSQLPDNVARAIRFVPNTAPHLGDLGYDSQHSDEAHGGEVKGAAASGGGAASGGKVRRLSNTTAPQKKGKSSDRSLGNFSGAEVQIPPGSPARAAVSRSHSLRDEGRGQGGRSSPKPRSSTPVRMSPLTVHSPLSTSPVTPTTPPPSAPGSPGDVFEAAGAGADYLKVSRPDDIKVKWKTVDNAEARDVAFMADGTVVVTEYKDGSDKLQLFDSSGNLQKCVACSSQNLIRPWSCAVNHQTGHIVVTDHGDRSVKTLDSDLSIRQVWRSLFDKPSGVAVMRTGDYVITDTATKAYMCSIHSTSGIRKREFANKGTCTGQLLTPNYVMSDHRDRIVISDTEQHCVKVFDTRGKQLLKFTSPANQPPMIPQGLCVDAQNNILVSDQAYRGISLYSSDGLFIQHVAKLPDAPWGVAVHDNGNLAIATDPSLYMYSVPMFRT